MKFRNDLPSSSPIATSSTMVGIRILRAINGEIATIIRITRKEMRLDCSIKDLDPPSQVLMRAIGIKI